MQEQKLITYTGKEQNKRALWLRIWLNQGPLKLISGHPSEPVSFPGYNSLSS